MVGNELKELERSLFNADSEVDYNNLMVLVLELKSIVLEQRVKELNFINYCHTGKFLEF